MSTLSKLAKILLTTLKWVGVVFALIWIFGQIAVKIYGFEQTVIFIGQAVGLPPEAFVDTSGSTVDAPVVDAVYAASYDVFFVASIVSSIGGVIILSQGRSLPEVAWLFAAFVLPRQRKYWGTLYDSSSGKIISFGVVRLFENQNGSEKFLSQAITDLDGHYRIGVNDLNKSYSLEVTADGYKTWKQDINVQNLQLAEKNIVIDIQLEPTGQATRSLRQTWQDFRNRMYQPTLIFICLVSVVALFFGIYGIVAYPDSFVNMISLIIALSATIWNIDVLRRRFSVSTGVIMDVETKQPLSGVQVQIFDGTKQLSSTLTDNSGIAKIGLPAGKYSAKIQKSGFGVPSSELMEVRINSKGFLTKNIYLEHTAKSQDSGNLLNPFAG